MRPIHGLDNNLSSKSQGRVFTNNLLRFFNELQSAGISISISEMEDAINATTQIDIFDSSQFYNALRATLVKEKQNFDVFDAVFEVFWRHRTQSRLETNGEVSEFNQSLFKSEENDLRETDGALAESSLGGVIESVQDREVSVSATYTNTTLYSQYEVLIKRDLRLLQANELEEIERLLQKIIRKLSVTAGRRTRSHAKGIVDLRRTVRANIQFGGELLKLARKKKALQKTRLLMVCDVSGSMRNYSQFAVQYIYALQNLFGKIETFVFSTRLSRVTSYLRHNRFETALERVSQSVLDWGGGTQIGTCLSTLNENYGHLLDRRTVVTIISDGWDTGDIALLEEQMRRLKQRTKRIIWLNPLLEDKDYEPICRGMQMALPFIDVFTSANTVKGLENFSKLLSYSQI